MMSDIELKRFVTEVVRPFFEGDLTLLQPIIDKERKKEEKAAAEAQEAFEKAEAELAAKVLKEREDSLAKKATEEASKKIAEEEEKEKDEG